MAVDICPNANRQINPAFYKTLDQAVSKYLNVQPQRLKLLAVDESEFDSILNP